MNAQEERIESGHRTFVLRQSKGIHVQSSHCGIYNWQNNSLTSQWTTDTLDRATMNSHVQWSSYNRTWFIGP
jgi:hypothetical protein